MNEKVIWKYNVKIEDLFEIEMPKDAIVLSVATQRGDPMMWVLVNPDANLEKRKFAVFGTGHRHADETWNHLHFIGTFILTGQDYPLIPINATLVFHLFEVITEGTAILR